MKLQIFIAQLLKEATIDLRKKLVQLDRDISKAMDVVLKPSESRSCITKN